MTRVALLLLSSLVQAVAGDPAAPPKRPAFGWVLDDARQPVVGARIEVLAAPGAPGASPPVAVTVSREFGRFELPALPPGRYVLRLQAAGYSTLTEPRVEIPTGTEPVDLGRFRLERTVVLEGRVLAAGGEPVWGAQIYLVPRGAGDGRRAARLAATSGRGGELRIPDLDRGMPVSLAVCRRGYLAASVTVPDPAAFVEVLLAPAARIEGRVVGPEREPIAGARLATDPRASEPPCGDLGTAKTNAEGKFVLESLLPGTYDLIAAADGYIGATVENVSAKKEGPATHVTIFLTRGAIVVGTVSSDAGGPVAGAEIQALGDNAQPKALSDAEGRFVLPGVEPVTQLVRVSHPDYRTTETTVRVEREGSSYDFVLSRIGRLAVSGSVVAPDGTAVEGARVQLGDKVLALTNAEGRFSFVKDNGTYELTAYKAGFAPGITRPPVVVDGRPVSGVEIRLGKSAVVTGRLLGLPAGTRAQVSAASPLFSVQGTAARDGTYRIADLAAGDWEVLAKAAKRTARGSVRLAKNDAEKTLDLSFAPLYEVSGWVLGPTGEPVAGAEVRFTPPAETEGDGALGQSGADGAYRVELEPGRYRAACLRPGYSPGLLPDPVEVAGAPVTKLVLRLEPGLAIRGRIRGLTEPYRTQEVWAEGAEGRRQRGTVASRGEYWVGGLAPGEYTVRASLMGRIASGTALLEAAQGEALLDLDLVLGNEMLHGRVQGPIPPGTVVELFSGQALAARAQVHSNGNFSVLHLTPGRYRLRLECDCGEKVVVEQEISIPLRGSLLLAIERPPQE